MGMADLKHAFINSMNGIKQTWKREKAFRLEILGCVVVLIGLAWSDATRIDKLFVIFLKMRLLLLFFAFSLPFSLSAMEHDYDPNSNSPKFISKPLEGITKLENEVYVGEALTQKGEKIYFGCELLDSSNRPNWKT